MGIPLILGWREREKDWKRGLRKAMESTTRPLDPYLVEGRS